MNSKKIITLTMVFLVVMFISACGISSEQNDVEGSNKDKGIDIDFSPPDEPQYFTGTIKEIIDEKRAIVLASVIKNNPEGLVFVSLSVNENEVFKVGDKIKVGFDGTVMESNPAQINTLSVELVN